MRLSVYLISFKIAVFYFSTLNRRAATQIHGALRHVQLLINDTELPLTPV